MADVTEIDYTTNPPTKIERDFTAEEKAQIEADKLALKLEENKIQEMVKAKTELLAKLGITEEEAKLLLT